MDIKCDYCSRPAELVGGQTIYPHRPDLFDLKFWLCTPCNAYVGCHKTSPNHAPLGRLADPELRKWKQLAHAAFDPPWKAGAVKRSHAYIWLSVKMGIPLNDCHIGRFNVDQCRRVVEIMAYLKKNQDH